MRRAECLRLLDICEFDAKIAPIAEILNHAGGAMTDDNEHGSDAKIVKDSELMSDHGRISDRQQGLRIVLPEIPHARAATGRQDDRLI